MVSKVDGPCAADGIERKERRYMAARFHERAKRTAAEFSRAEAVVEEANSHAALGGGNECVEETLALAIGAEDVELQMNVIARILDRFEVRRVRCFDTDEHVDRVARHHIDPADARRETHDAPQLGRLLG
jgi:hypothetical protein